MRVSKLYFLLIIVLISACKNDTKQESAVEVEDTFAGSEIKFEKLENAVLAGGQLLRKDSFPTKLIAERTVDVWLPEGYSEEKKYGVLYMHDGQNLFDATTTWNNQEWMVDEISSLLMNNEETSEFIVVGVHNISDIRYTDYFPRKAFEMLPKKVQDSLFNLSKNDKSPLSLDNLQADNYLKFIVDELKPYIDTHFSTHKSSDYTMISGSSMGGLISMYAICEYPEVFGGAACISTHWPGVMPGPNNPVPAVFFQYLDQKIPPPGKNKFYFDYGTETLDTYYPPFAGPLDSIFKSKGYTDQNYQNLKFDGADHSEASWQQRFDIPLKFLFKK